jgi:outer membrane protein insertion porin family
MTRLPRPLALMLAFALTACGASRSAVVAPAKPASSSATPAQAEADSLDALASPVRPCPESILPGGDRVEAPAFEGKPVVRVCLLGGSEESRTIAQRAIGSRPGAPATGERVRADLEAIMRLGVFDDASAYGLRVKQGTSVVLFFVLHERPRIAEIAFEGAKVVGDASLNAKLPIQKESRYDPSKVNEIAQALRDEYRTRGYDSCRVKLVSEPAAGAPDHVRVRIVVDEGPLWRVTKIDFRGNQKLSAADLRRASGLKVGQPFVEQDVERASLVLSAFYYDRGFIDLRLVSERGAAAGPGARPVTFVIDEGAVHTIGALHASKLGAAVEKELLDKVVRARAKQVFSRSKIVDDIARVKAHFAGKGQTVEVVPLTEVDPEHKTVDVTFAIEPARPDRRPPG